MGFMTDNPLWRWRQLTPPGIHRPYLWRMKLADFGFGIRVYLHRYVGSDWSFDPHDHPKGFLSIGLRGGYVEEVYPFSRPLSRLQHTGPPTSRQYRAPWIRYFGPTHRHRLRVVPRRGCLTICVTGWVVRTWGFVSRKSGDWIPAHVYFATKVREAVETKAKARDIPQRNTARGYSLVTRTGGHGDCEEHPSH